MKLTKFLTLAAVALILLTNAFDGRAQDTDNQTREIKSDVFTDKRPVSSVTRKKVYRTKKRIVRKKPRPVPTVKNDPKPTPQTKKQPLTTEENVERFGVTLWRLRPEKTGEPGARLLTMNGAEKLVAERVSFDTIFRRGDKVRLSLESPMAGFLYIVDREILLDAADGKTKLLGDPYLIFPTLSTVGGDNRAMAGKVIEIPAQSDKPFYFEITPQNPNYLGELLTVIISPEKLTDFELRNEPVKLSGALVEKWEDEWESNGEVFESDDQTDSVYTEEEKLAGAGTRLLTQKEPPPQTIFELKTPKGKAFLFSFEMRVGK